MEDDLPGEFCFFRGQFQRLLVCLQLEKIESFGGEHVVFKEKDSPEEEFPIVPTQLQSCTKLKTFEEKRMKFLTKLSFFNNSIDLSGIVNGAKKGGKLVINGQHYSF